MLVGWCVGFVLLGVAAVQISEPDGNARNMSVGKSSSSVDHAFSVEAAAGASGLRRGQISQ